MSASSRDNETSKLLSGRDKGYSSTTRADSKIGEADCCVHHQLVTSRVRIANLCCAGEERIIHDILSKMTGIENVSVNIVSKFVTIRHCYLECCSRTVHIVDELNKKHLGASIQEVSQDDDQQEELPVKQIIHIAVLWVLSLLGLSLHWRFLKVSWALYLTVVLIGGFPIIEGVYIAILRRAISIHVLMFVALVGALIGGELFDGCLVVTLFASGELAEALILRYVRNAVNRSTAPYPKEVTLADGTVVELSKIKESDVVMIHTGDVIIVDGIVTKGQAAVDESSLTGESKPISKSIGDTVVSGSIMLNGFIHVTVTLDPISGTVQKMSEIIDDIQSERSNYSKIIDEIAGWWTPLILGFVFCFVIIGGLVSGQWPTVLRQGLVIMVLACPCSLLLATPIPTSCAVAQGAKHGVLIRGLGVIEDVANVEIIALDKTGTLTTGQFAVCSQHCIDEDGETVTYLQSDEDNPMRLAAALENQSTHPLAKAIISEYCGCITDFDTTLPHARQLTVLEGVGLSAWVEVDNDWKFVQVGNEHLFKEHGGSLSLLAKQKAVVESFINAQPTAYAVLFVVVDDVLCAMLSVADQVRPEAESFVRALHADNSLKNVTMLTGDAPAVANEVASAIGIDTDNVHARLRPTDKLKWVARSEGQEGNVMVKSLSAMNTVYSHLMPNTSESSSGDVEVGEASQDGRESATVLGRVMMVGDGFNDSPSLAAASVGVVMGRGGAAVSVTAAKIILMDENLMLIPATKRMCQYTSQVVLQNCVMSISFKAIAIIVALTSNLHLWQAILIDIGTLVLVMLNGIRPLYSDIFDSVKNA